MGMNNHRQHGQALTFLVASTDHLYFHDMTNLPPSKMFQMILQRLTR
jgi:hypothetical protein